MGPLGSSAKKAGTQLLICRHGCTFDLEEGGPRDSWAPPVRHPYPRGWSRPGHGAIVSVILNPGAEKKIRMRVRVATPPKKGPTGRRNKKKIEAKRPIHSRVGGNLFPCYRSPLQCHPVRRCNTRGGDEEEDTPAKHKRIRRSHVHAAFAKLGAIEQPRSAIGVIGSYVLYRKCNSTPVLQYRAP